MSPGNYTLEKFIGLGGKRERRRTKQETGQFKKRRLQLKEKKRQGQEFRENLVFKALPPEREVLCSNRIRCALE